MTMDEMASRHWQTNQDANRAREFLADIQADFTPRPEPARP